MSHRHSSPDLTSTKFVFPSTSGSNKNRVFHRLSNSFLPNRIKPVGIWNFKQIVTHFERQSTFHGICHAATAKDKTSRLFWHIAFVICFLLLAVQIFWVIQKYQQYPKAVDLDIEFENISFPAVTLCNLNPYKASAIAKDTATSKTMDAFTNVLSNIKTGSRSKRATPTPPHLKRRYHQVYSKCYCESKKLNASSISRSCFSAFERSSEFDASSNATDLSKYTSSKCLCQFDLVSKALWPCFPSSSWKERLCSECHPELGHCPMKFHDVIDDESLNITMDLCKCNKDYNHCVANNELGVVPEIFSTDDIQTLKFTPDDDEDEEDLETTTQAVEFIQAMGFEELLDEIAIHSQAQQNLMFAVGEKKDHEKVALSHSRDELILKCSFNQRDCDIEKDFLLHYDPTYGNCYTFNWNRTQPVTVHRAGANYGLRVLLYSNRSEYLPTSEAIGFRITIHDQWSVPFPDAFGYSAPTGFMSSFGVRMKQFHRISPPHGNCLHGGEKSEFYIYKGFNYSVEGCHRSCTQNEVIRVCGCADPMYPIPNNTLPCSVNNPKARECIKKVTSYLGLAMAEGRLPNCSCHQPCSEIAYEVYFSTAGWPSGATKLIECEPHDDMCLEKYRKNAAMIQVFYEELNYETLTESPAYTWMSVLADIGGLTGLWIGASVVSLLEIVMLAYYSMQAYQKQRNPNSPLVVKNDECTPLKRYSKFIGNTENDPPI